MPEAGRLVVWARGASVAFEFCGSIAAGALLGWWIDERFGVGPWGAISLTVLGTVGGFIRLVRMLKRFEHIDRGAER